MEILVEKILNIRILNFFSYNTEITIRKSETKIIVIDYFFCIDDVQNTFLILMKINRSKEYSFN